MAEPAPQPAITLNGVTKTYGGKPVLQGIDLVVPKGQVLGYVGPNGAGKSTTVKILVGMIAGFDGEATVAGHDVRRQPLEVKQRIGYVPEVAAFYESLTVFEHLLLVGRLYGLSDRVTQKRAEALLEVLELGARIHSPIGSLSKGMRQKLLFTAAVLHDPEILFLDEPLSGLDVQSTVLIKEFVRSLALAGKTVFYCSHILDVVERVCDRIVVLRAGQIVADGPFAALVERSRGGGTLEQVFLELTADGGASRRAQALIDAMRQGSA
ncbi:MAG TPA: ABC transporter ATP-binding protein [Planctomycetota bacterium]|nr:ABC transporter ATP-binding protein [Planctomycetota bacterium]